MWIFIWWEVTFVYVRLDMINSHVSSSNILIRRWQVVDWTCLLNEVLLPFSWLPLKRLNSIQVEKIHDKFAESAASSLKSSILAQRSDSVCKWRPNLEANKVEHVQSIKYKPSFSIFKDTKTERSSWVKNAENIIFFMQPFNISGIKTTTTNINNL